MPAWRPLPWKSLGICLTAHAGTGTHLQVADALACMVHSSIRTLQRHEKVSSSMIRRHCKLDKPHSRGACAALALTISNLLQGQLWPRGRQLHTRMLSSIA